jgi:hypothetical protein
VVPAGSSAHGFSCSRRLSPLSGRNSTYRPVQISATGSKITTQNRPKIAVIASIILTHPILLSGRLIADLGFRPASSVPENGFVASCRAARLVFSPPLTAHERHSENKLRRGLSSAPPCPGAPRDLSFVPTGSRKDENRKADGRRNCLAVQPPRGISIAIAERPGRQNWVAGVAAMDPERTIAFSAKVASLAKTDPIIDWSAITERDGEHRYIARWLSEVLSG